MHCARDHILDLAPGGAGSAPKRPDSDIAVIRASGCPEPGLPTDSKTANGGQAPERLPGALRAPDVCRRHAAPVRSPCRHPGDLPRPVLSAFFAVPAARDTLCASACHVGMPAPKNSIWRSVGLRQSRAPPGGLPWLLGPRAAIPAACRLPASPAAFWHCPLSRALPFLPITQ